jgi:hypothetical protein
MFTIKAKLDTIGFYTFRFQIGMMSAKLLAKNTQCYDRINSGEGFRNYVEPY